MAGAVKYAEQWASRCASSCICPTTALRYISKYPRRRVDARERLSGRRAAAWARSRDLLKPARCRTEVLTAKAGEAIKSVVQRMKQHGVSQLPVLDGEKLLGVITEKDLLTFLVTGEAKLDSSVGSLVETAFATVEQDTPVATLSGLFNQGTVVLVLQDKRITGVVTKIDLIEFMADKLTA